MKRQWMVFTLALVTLVLDGGAGYSNPETLVRDLTGSESTSASRVRFECDTSQSNPVTIGISTHAGTQTKLPFLNWLPQYFPNQEQAWDSTRRGMPWFHP